MKHTILRVSGYWGDSYWHIPILSEEEKITLDKIIEAIPECYRFQTHRVYKDVRNFCKQHGQKITIEKVNELLAENDEVEKSDNPLVNLLREWEYEMASLEQHDYDAMCKKTDQVLAEYKQCPK
jgi:hypothetical protein